LLALLAVALLQACATDDCAVPATVSHPKAGKCQQCASDVDCAEGLACDHETFACKSPAMVLDQLHGSGGKQCSADCGPPCGLLYHCKIGPGPAWANYVASCIPDDVTCTGGDCRY